MSKLSLLSIGAVAGAFFMSIFGFAALGWKLDSKAQIMAKDAANAELARVLIPACVAQFHADPDVETHKAALNDMQFFHPRMLYVEKGGWAIMPGQKNASRGIARGCTEALKLDS